MLHISSLDEGLELFKALGSDIRVEIIKILLNESGMNMNELASRLKITNGALTSHIRKLEECGIVTVSSEGSGHGNQKVCSVKLDKILIDLQNAPVNENVYNTSIKIGHFSDYEVYPTCGLASGKKLIGEVDDTRYFAHPDRYEADILWFTRGYVDYILPNFIPSGQKIDEICISAELSSEAPGVNNIWPSDIYFYLNDVLLGTWISPGDFGDVKGIFTPDWWFSGWNQYGMLKMLVVNHKGSFIDGIKISDVTIDSLGINARSSLKLRLEVPENAEHVGGLTIFGKSFGNYNQDINVKIAYSPMENI
jgi:predicted transcriptional regulator